MTLKSLDLVVCGTCLFLLRLNCSSFCAQYPWAVSMSLLILNLLWFKVYILASLLNPKYVLPLTEFQKWWSKIIFKTILWRLMTFILFPIICCYGWQGWKSIKSWKSWTNHFKFWCYLNKKYQKHLFWVTLFYNIGYLPRNLSGPFCA